MGANNGKSTSGAEGAEGAETSVGSSPSSSANSSSDEVSKREDSTKKRGLVTAEDKGGGAAGKAAAADGKGQARPGMAEPGAVRGCHPPSGFNQVNTRLAALNTPACHDSTAPRSSGSSLGQVLIPGEVNVSKFVLNPPEHVTAPVRLKALAFCRSRDHCDRSHAHLTRVPASLRGGAAGSQPASQPIQS